MSTTTLSATTRPAQCRLRPRSWLLCGLFVTWCLLSHRSRLVAAQGSASSTTGVCNLGTFVPSLPPWASLPPVYPNGSVTYERMRNTVPPENFFIAHWYIPVILILCAVCGFYILLALWIVYYFEFYAQHQAQKVVEKSYIEKGYFHLRDGDREMAESYSREQRQSRSSQQRSRGTRSGGGGGASRSAGFVASTVYADGESAYTSDSYDETESSSPSSEDRDTAVRVNPLRR